MEAVIFGLYLDLQNVTSSGKSQGIFYCLAAGNPDERNVPKFVMFISILWYPQKWKGQILAHDNHPVTERGVSLTTVYTDFSSFFFIIALQNHRFHNTTKGGCLSARIVIIICYNQILYDNKQPNAMLWSSSQM